MTFGTQIEIAEITAAFFATSSPNLGIAARPASALEAIMDAARLRQITNPARLIPGSTVSQYGLHPRQEGLHLRRSRTVLHPHDIEAVARQGQ